MMIITIFGKCDHYDLWSVGITSTHYIQQLLDPHNTQMVIIPKIVKWIIPEVVPENLKMEMLKIDWLTLKQCAYAKMVTLIMDHLDSAIPNAAHILLNMENPKMALLPYMVTLPDMHLIVNLFAVATEINWPLLLMDFITKYGNLMSVLKFTKNGNLLFLMDDNDPCAPLSHPKWNSTIFQNWKSYVRYVLALLLMYCSTVTCVWNTQPYYLTLLLKYRYPHLLCCVGIMRGC